MDDRQLAEILSSQIQQALTSPKVRAAMRGTITTAIVVSYFVLLGIGLAVGLALLIVARAIAG